MKHLAPKSAQMQAQHRDAVPARVTSLGLTAKDVPVERCTPRKQFVVERLAVCDEVSDGVALLRQRSLRNGDDSRVPAADAWRRFPSGAACSTTLMRGLRDWPESVPLAKFRRVPAGFLRRRGSSFRGLRSASSLPPFSGRMVARLHSPPARCAAAPGHSLRQQLCPRSHGQHSSFEPIMASR
jgi:hypothetical protein